MSGLSGIIKSALIEHQQHYDMVSYDPPMSFCYCGKGTEIDLPSDRITWSDHVKTFAALEAHATHQTEMILKKISE